MARIQLEFPDSAFCYSTEMAVRVTDVNASGHLGNDSLISLISEARARFLFDRGITGGNIIVTDLVATYRAEAHARDQLCFEIGVIDFNRYGGDVVFRITRCADNALIAMAKTGFVFFDYRAGKIAPMPETFSSQFPRVNWIS